MSPARSASRRRQPPRRSRQQRRKARTRRRAPCTPAGPRSTRRRPPPGQSKSRRIASAVVSPRGQTAPRARRKPAARRPSIGARQHPTDCRRSRPSGAPHTNTQHRSADFKGKGGANEEGIRVADFGSLVRLSLQPFACQPDHLTCRSVNRFQLIGLTKSSPAVCSVQFKPKIVGKLGAFLFSE